MEQATAKLRKLLARPGCIVAPGVADALAARLVALAGFDVVYMTGFGTSLTRLGMPDVGLLTATEMIDNAGRIVDAAGLPVVADADTGYGNPIITRTDAIAVEGLEAALERGERYREAGADVLFIEAPVGREQVERVARHFNGVPEDQRASL